MSKATKLLQVLVAAGLVATLHQEDDYFEGDEFIRVGADRVVEVHPVGGQIYVYWTNGEMDELGDSEKYVQELITKLKS